MKSFAFAPPSLFGYFCGNDKSIIERQYVFGLDKTIEDFSVNIFSIKKKLTKKTT